MSVKKTDHTLEDYQYYTDYEGNQDPEQHITFVAAAYNRNIFVGCICGWEEYLGLDADEFDIWKSAQGHKREFIYEK